MDFSEFYFSYWMWFLLALVFLGLELIAPGVVFLWIAVGAGAVGLVVMQVPALSPEIQGVAFIALSGSAVWAGRRYFWSSANEQEASADPSRSERLIGKIYPVVQAIEHGRGRVRVGDSTWTAEGADAPEGSHVRVTAADGIVLTVEPVQETGDD